MVSEIPLKDLVVITYQDVKEVNFYFLACALAGEIDHEGLFEMND